MAAGWSAGSPPGASLGISLSFASAFSLKQPLPATFLVTLYLILSLEHECKRLFGWSCCIHPKFLPKSIINQFYFRHFLAALADQKHRGLKNTGKALLESHASPALVIGGSAKDCIEPWAAYITAPIYTLDIQFITAPIYALDKWYITAPICTLDI